jgi:hypothetical protein
MVLLDRITQPPNFTLDYVTLSREEPNTVEAPGELIDALHQQSEPASFVALAAEQIAECGCE